MGAKTDRERAYFAAVRKLYGDFDGTPQHVRLRAYRDDMGTVAAKYPQDHEAQIFYALALAVAADPADKTYADQHKAGALLGAAGGNSGHCGLGMVLTTVKR